MQLFKSKFDTQIWWSRWNSTFTDILRFQIIVFFFPKIKLETIPNKKSQNLLVMDRVKQHHVKNSCIKKAVVQLSKTSLVGVGCEPSISVSVDAISPFELTRWQCRSAASRGAGLRKTNEERWRQTSASAANIWEMSPVGKNGATPDWITEHTKICTSLLFK